MGESKHQAFVREYLKDGNGKQAAIRAGYSPRSAEQQASALLRNPKVKAALKLKVDKAELKSDEFLAELRRIALLDPKALFDEHGELKRISDMPEDARRAVAGIDVEKLFEGHGEDREHIGNVHKLKLWSKVDALKLGLQHLGLLVDKREVSLNVNLASLLDDEADPGAAP